MKTAWYSHKWLWPFILLQFVLFWIVRHDPIFGDGVSTVARASTHFLENNLQTFWYLTNHDPGHPTLIPWFIAALWALFGPHLWIAHLLMALIGCGILILMYRISALFISINQQWIPLLLTVLFPTYLSQSAMVLTHLPLCLFMLATVYGLLSQKPAWLVTGAVLMVLTHLEGVFLLSGIIAADLLIYLKQPKSIKGWIQWIQYKWWIYGIPIVGFGVWAIAHLQQFGWAVTSPNYIDHRTWGGIQQFFLNLLLIGWRISDYGAIGLLLIAIAGAFHREVRQHKLFKLYAALTVITVIEVAIFLSNSIAHRYFLPHALLLILLVGYLISQFTPKTRKLIWPLVAICLLLGNFLHYPGKCIGDPTLAYRGYFSIAKQIETDFPKAQFYSYPPLAAPYKWTYLEDQGPDLHPIYETNLDTLPYVLHSNLTCDFTTSELKKLSTWPGKTYESGYIWITVRRNPNMGEAPNDWQVRQKTDLELWMEDLKQQFKN